MPDLKDMHTRYGRGQQWKQCSWCLQAAAHTIEEHNQVTAKKGR